MADKKITISVDIVSDGSNVGKVKTTLNQITDEVKRINKETAEDKKRTDKIIEDSTKNRARAELDIEKSLDKSKKNFLRSLETASKESANKIQGIFKDVFAGTFLGQSAATGVTYGLSKAFDFLKSSFERSMDLSSSIRALAQFEGGVDKANDRITKLIQVANQTPGLTFDSAVQGQQRLEAVGFQADKATQLLSGLAKVRILSGTSQSDFDIMVAELAKFAVGGEQAGRVFRELANHMPYLIQIMVQQFGKLDKATIEKARGPQKFLEKLIDTMGKINPQFNSTSLAVENLGDSWDRLKISIGRIVEQNPEVIAMLEHFTNELNGNTTALNQNDSELRKNAKGWISWAAGATLSVENFADLMRTVMAETGTYLGGLMSVFAESINTIFRSVPKAINDFVITPINAVKNALANSGIPGLSQAVGGVADIPMIAAGEGDIFLGPRTALSSMFSNLQKNASGYNNRRDARNADYAKMLQALTNSQTGPQSVNPLYPGSYKYSTNTEEMLKNLGAPGEKGTGSGRGGTLGKARGADLPAFGSMTDLVISSGNPQWDSWFVEMGHKWGVDPNVLLLQATKESSRNAAAVSPKGAKGFSQFMPGTAARFKVNTSSVKDSIRGQAEYDSFLLSMFGNDYSQMLAGYNAGEGAVQKYHGIPPFKETRDYVSKIKGAYSRRVRSGKSYGTYEMPEDQGLQTSNSGLNEMGVEGRDKEIEQLQKEIDLYSQLSDTIFNLTERTHEETAVRETEIGQYKDLNPELKEAIINTAKLQDAQDAKRKSDEDAANSQKEAQDALEQYRQKQQQVFDETTGFFENKINTLISGGFKGLWKSILDDMKRNFVHQFSQLLAQAFSGGGTASGSQGGGGIGGLFKGIFGGMGPGGTANFNPNASGGSGGGFLSSIFGGGGQGGGSGIGSLLGSLFGKKGGGSAGQGVGGGLSKGLGGLFGGGGGDDADEASASGGGMNVSGIGSLIGMGAMLAGGAIGGRLGRTLQGAGMGAQIGGMFGPLGLAIGAGAGALIGFFMGGDDAIKKIKEAALSTYGLTVKDKSTLNAIKQIGETYFGKGKVGANATQLMGIDEVKNILRNYAEATGQNGAKIDMLSHADPNWAGNQIRSSFGGFRAIGGPVMAGKSYIVGEQRAEMFTPTQNGFISPTVGNTQMQASQADAMYQIAEQLARIQFVPAGHVLQMGAEQNPDAIYTAHSTVLQRSPRAPQDFRRSSGEQP